MRRPPARPPARSGRSGPSPTARRSIAVWSRSRPTRSRPTACSSRCTGRASTTRTASPPRPPARWRASRRSIPGIDLAGVTVEDAPGMPGRAPPCSPTATTSACRDTVGSPSTHVCPPSGWCRCPTACRRATRWWSAPPGSPPAMSVIALQEHGVTPDAGPGARHRRHRRCRLDRGRHARRPRLRGGRQHRQARVGRASCTALGATSVDRSRRAVGGGQAAARVDRVGRGGRLRRRRHARQRAEEDPLRRVGRGERPHRRRRAADHRAAVHPARRQPARHRLGDAADGPPASPCGSGSRPTCARPVSIGSGTTSPWSSSTTCCRRSCAARRRGGPS